jgi:nicotinamide-nucleotide amidase
MAAAALKKFGADISISTTGIAGPGGATDEKPVGLIYIGLATANRIMVRKFHLFGTREQFMQRAANCVMVLLKEVLKTDFKVS